MTETYNWENSEDRARLDDYVRQYRLGKEAKPEPGPADNVVPKLVPAPAPISNLSMSFVVNGEKVLHVNATSDSPKLLGSVAEQIGFLLSDLTEKG